MKKIFALLLAIVMVMGLATVASASGFAPAPETSDATFEQDNVTYHDSGIVTFKKVYKLENAGTVSPEETFTFSAFNCTGVENAEAGVTAENAPLPTIGSVTFAEGTATTIGAEGTVTITLPGVYAYGEAGQQDATTKRHLKYPSVGEYTYTFNEISNGVAGVTYYTNTMKLVVTVVRDDDYTGTGNDRLRIAAVHCESAGEKSDKFENKYSAGDLSVSKTVTGNLGDQQKYFNVTVSFESAKPVNAPIYVKNGSMGYDYEVTAWTEANGKYTASTEIQVKHGDTVDFENIPYDVTYTVVEDSYDNDGYDAAAYNFSDNAKKVDTAEDTVMITNNKDEAVDTGIVMDSVPFVVMAVIAVLGLAAFTAKKRVQE